MGDETLLAGTRNAEVYVYKEDPKWVEQAESEYFLSVEMPGSTVEYPISEETAEMMQEDMVDGETIRERQKTGDW